MNILFFDLEWVPIAESFTELQQTNPQLADAWISRCSRWKDLGKFEKMTVQEIWDASAGFNPEFIKIVVASFGYEKGNGEFKLTSFTGDEKDILQNIKSVLDGAPTYRICGHGIKRFDMPYLGKRMLANNINLPYHLNNYGKKPWDLSAIDTIEMWGCGTFAESYTPLNTICAALNIPTSKSDISGGDVARVYYNEGVEGLQRIVEYCEKDVEVTAKVYKTINDLITTDYIK